jgi:hypothetical protein
LEGNSCLLSSGAPDSPVRHRTATVVCPVHDFLPKRAQSTVAALDPLAHRTLSGAHRTVRCFLPTVGAATRCPQISRPIVGARDRWLTGQSGAPPDSLGNYSHVAFVLSISFLLLFVTPQVLPKALTREAHLCPTHTIC